MKGKKKQLLALFLSGTLALAGSAFDAACLRQAKAADYSDEVQVTVAPGEEQREISPYIYGINYGGSIRYTYPKSIRLGGNRFTAYNWENNYSNAGSDWNHHSDTYAVDGLDASMRDVPGAAALGLSALAAEYQVPYTLMTVQMAGYVAADKNGTVSPEEAAPSNRWRKTAARKDGELSLTPDLTDDTVYIDEFVNYLVHTLGDAGTPAGIKAYSLDNEPALWNGTHSLVHPEAATCAEIVELAKEYAAAIKDVDPKAEIFGPALYGFAAYTTFQGASDWNALAAERGYRWFPDYYLDEMRKAEEEGGRRLLDVFDVHYYTEACGACGERSCNHYDNEDCIDARLQSVRTLSEEGYIEDSWIGQWGQSFLPILPNLQQSIDEYYPGTKLGISEYNFGGGDHISGGIAQADAFGTFGKNGVYFATLWMFDDKAHYQWNTFALFTNYDGKGNGFGSTSVHAETSDVSTVSAYAAIDGESEETVRLILNNKNQHGPTKVTVSLDGDVSYRSAEVYGIYQEGFGVVRGEDIAEIKDNTLTCELPSLCIVELVVKSEAAAAADAENKPSEGAVSTPAPTASASENEESKEDSVPWGKVAVGAAVVAGIVLLAGIVVGVRRRKKPEEKK